MGLDIGDRWIGVALSDPLGILASPVTIIDREGEKDIQAAVLDIIRENDIERIVIGLPYNMNGSLGHQAGKVQDFADTLGRLINIPIDFRDERLSTCEAREKLQSAGRTGSRTRYDAAAAALILQGYLDEMSR